MTVSKKHIIVLSVLLITFSACGKKEKELTPAQIRSKADSIVQSKMGKLKQQAKEDLDRRLPIEIKPKVDSILNIDHNEKTVPVFPDDNMGAEQAEPTADSVKK